MLQLISQLFVQVVDIFFQPFVNKNLERCLAIHGFFLILIFSQTCTNYVKQIRQLEFFPNILLFLIESTC